jgi:hypothetical protein
LTPASRWQNRKSRSGTRPLAHDRISLSLYHVLDEVRTKDIGPIAHSENSHPVAASSSQGVSGKSCVLLEKLQWVKHVRFDGTQSLILSSIHWLAVFHFRNLQKDTASLLRRCAELLGTHQLVEERDMGWLFRSGCSRRELIAERTEDWRRTAQDGLVVKTTCLAHCYRGGSFSGVLWTVWGRSFTKDGVEVQPTERWIGCDLLRSQKGFGWGYKDMDESMGPYFYSCPLKYLVSSPSKGSADTPSGGQRCAGITSGRLRNGAVGSQSKGHHIDSA